MILERSRIIVLLAAVSVFAFCSTAVGQANNADTRAIAEDDLNNFVHYVMIAKPDLARSSALHLFQTGATNAELAEIVDSTMDAERFETALARAHVIGDLEDVAAQLETRVESGRLDLSRDPERIEQAIRMLVGTQRGRMLAKRRLEAAGEYAVPALLNEVTSGNDANLRLQCREMLVEIGRRAVTPLAVAIPNLAPENQIIVADVLGRIRWGHAAPYLAALGQEDNVPQSVQEAIQRNYARVSGTGNTVATQFAALSRQYFNNETSLIAYPTEATNNVWSYDQFVGLVGKPVATEIFSEVMAMRLARRALAFDNSSREALAIFIAANLKRENDLPEGMTDPIYGEARFTPEFYAMAAGPAIIQDVMGIALDNEDTMLIRDAIAALSNTAGGANLWTATGGRQPLVESLRYPDRRVQYDAALALGKANPQEPFDGAFQVVPTLASAVMAGDESYALVIADDPEDQNEFAGQLEEIGFSVIATASRVGDASMAVNDSPGVDLVFIRSNRNNARQAVEELRTSPRTTVAPILIYADATDKDELDEAFARDDRAKVNLARFGPGTLEAAVNNLMQTAVGGRMDEGQAQLYAAEAIATLRDIAISRSQAYAIADAETALIESLSLREGTIRGLVADVLALIDSSPSQQALIEAAFNAPGREQVTLLRRTADSAKRFGDLVEERHVNRLMTLIEGGGDAAEAAAAVHGALNLPPANIVELLNADG